MEDSSESSEDEDRQHPPKEERQKKNGRADVGVKGTKRKKKPPARETIKTNEKEPERRSKDKKTQIQKVEDSVRFFHQVMYGGIIEPEKKKRKRKKKPSLVDAMCGRRDGLGKLLDVFACFEFDDGEANTIPPEQLLMQGMDILEEWQLKLAPYFTFKDFLREVEKLSDNKKIRATIAALRENKNAQDRQVAEQEEEDGAPSQNENLS